MTNTSYAKILEEIHSHARKCGRDPESIQVIAVSKFQPLESIRVVYDAGCRHFGENRVAEALEKIDFFPGVEWHLIGTLQTKKVNKVIGKFALIHSVDSLELAKKISSASGSQPTAILLQVNTSGEETKHGFTPSSCKETFDKLLQLSGIVIQGFMTMAPLTDDQAIIRRTFQALRKLRDELLPSGNLSMGMSNDWPIAIEEGATHLRIGSKIFKTITD